MTNSRWHRIARPVLALAVGIAVALYAYQRVSDPLPREQRRQEETVVLEARRILANYAALDRDLEIADPLNRNRAAGKVYIYPVDDGWQVSGHYRRAGETRWRPWLMTLDGDRALVRLRVEDAALSRRAETDARLVVVTPAK